MPRNSTLGRPLTDRQREILETYAKSGSTQGASQLLFLSDKTVRNSLSEIYAQLGVKSGIAAVWKVYVES